MHQGHLDPDQMLALLGGGLADQDLRSARDHVFGCPSCEGGLANALAHLGPGGAAHRKTGPGRAATRRRPAGSSLARLAANLEKERREAPELLRRLEAERSSEPHGRTRIEREFRTWGLFEHLIDEALGLLTSKPARARELVSLALLVAARLDGGTYGQARTETAKMRGWTQLGNIQRILGDFEAAEKAFRRAEFHYWQSDLDPLDEAALLEWRASLRRHQNRFEDAIELIDGAISTYAEVNEPHRQGRATMIKGAIELCSGSPDRAAEEFGRSLALLDPELDVHLPASCLLNQILCLTEADRAGEAAVLLPEVKSRAEKVTFGAADLLRLRWIEARVDLGLGRLEEAEVALRGIQALFVEEGMVVDAALATLDLAALLLRAKRTFEIPELVQEIVPVFQSLQIGREALASLVLLQQAAEAERLTLALVREAMASVRSSPATPAASAKP